MKYGMQIKRNREGCNVPLGVFVLQRKVTSRQNKVFLIFHTLG